VKAFWQALGGWLAGQLVLGLFVSMAGVPPFPIVLTHSLALGAFGACVGPLIYSGRENVPTFGCLAYFAAWVLLSWAGWYLLGLLGLPGELIRVTMVVGLLTGFWLQGDGPLSPFLLCFLLVFSWVYGALSLFTPPAVFSLRNVGLTLALLAAFEVVHVVVARLLRPRRRK